MDFITDINRDYAVALHYDAVDRFLVKILWWHLGFTVLMAFTNWYLRLSERFPSPFSWRVLSAQEVLLVLPIGIAAAGIPALVRGKLRNHYAWRVIVSSAFTVYSYLFVFMSGGSIEMHFHFFMVMALVTVYSDWRLGWVVLVLTALHHAILNYVAPGWVYSYGRNDLAVIAHALPVTATAIFTSLLCNNNRRSVAMQVAARQMVEREIDDRMRAQEAMAKAEAEAERANQSKSEFLSRTSHELRTPLNAILGFAQLLEMDSLTPEQREGIEHILKGGRHLLDLINEVLDIARIETGRMTISPQPVLVRGVVEETLDMIRPFAAEMNVALNGGALGAYSGHIWADGQRVKQILLNLLSNGIKYNRQGGTVTLSCEETADARLRITVSDTGPGISPEKIERLFTPFDRLGAEKTEIEGTGLGLALSKRLVEVMGGRMGVESTSGQGSVFWVEFPLVVSPVEESPRDDPGAPSPAHADASPRPATVLYVEDNLSNIELIQRLLTHRPGVNLLPAMQGRLGLDLARRHRPDLILLDLHLPDIPGDEVLRRLREVPETRHIPVIMISADANPGQMQRLVAAGAWRYLTKPLDVKQFLSLLDDALPGSGSSPVRTLLPL